MRQEKFSAEFIAEAAVFVDIGDADLDFDPRKLNFDYTARIADSGILDFVDESVFNTEEFNIARIEQHHQGILKQVKVKRGEYEYGFTVPNGNTTTRRFTRTSLSNPKNNLTVILTPFVVDIIENRESNGFHLWNSEAALWVARGAINEFNLTPVVRGTLRPDA